MAGADRLDRPPTGTLPVLYVVRHGEAGDGRWPLPAQAHLTPRGHAQALSAAGALRAQIPAGAPLQIHASDLPRSRETAEAIARGLGGSVSCDARLRELDFGWEGETLMDILRRVGEERLQAFLRAPAGTELPGAEPFPVFWRRVEDALREIAQTRAPAVVVAHDGVNRALALLSAGRGPGAWADVAPWRHGEVRALALRGSP